MSYAHLLKTNNFSWLPKFARNKNEANYAPRIAKFRRNWAAAQKSNRKSIENRFELNYKGWLTSIKQGNAQRRANFFRAVEAGKRQTVPRAHSASPPRSGRRRNSRSLLKNMHNARLEKTKTNLRIKIAALESQRNNIERQLNSLRREIRDLPSRTRSLYQ